MPQAQTRVRRTRAERREETSSRILDAAVSELHRKGYAGFRFNHVVLAAHASKGAVTHHFPTKESLVIAALKRIYDESHAQSMKLIEALRPLDKPNTVLEALIRDAEEFYLGPSFATSVAMLSVSERETDLGRQLATIARAHRIPIEQAWLDALMRSGLSEEKARGLLYMTQSIYRGMVMRRYMRDDPDYIRFTTEQWRKVAFSMID